MPHIFHNDTLYSKLCDEEIAALSVFIAKKQHWRQTNVTGDERYANSYHVKSIQVPRSKNLTGKIPITFLKGKKRWN